ncbi:MAG: DUF4402 domain-containing protein [Bacteroidales bacterium]|nr:DUF4402 domain-containing protein [Bacteroidales bacterium]
MTFLPQPSPHRSFRYHDSRKLCSTLPIQEHFLEVPQEIKVGATLNVSASQAAGTYTNASGLFVTVNYN